MTADICCIISPFKLGKINQSKICRVQRRILCLNDSINIIFKFGIYRFVSCLCKYENSPQNICVKCRRIVKIKTCFLAVCKPRSKSVDFFVYALSRSLSCKQAKYHCNRKDTRKYFVEFLFHFYLQ